MFIGLESPEFIPNEKVFPALYHLHVHAQEKGAEQFLFKREDETT
jgi:hypothetical protein